MSTPDPDHQITDYLMGELAALDELDVQAEMRGNADLRREAQAQSDMARALEKELRMGPGGLSDGQRDQVLDELDAVLAARTEKRPRGERFRKMVFGERSGRRPKVRQAFFSPTARALNAISVAAAVVAVVVTGYQIKVVKGFGGVASDDPVHEEAADMRDFKTTPREQVKRPKVVAFANQMAEWEGPGFLVDDEALYEEVLEELAGDSLLSEEEQEDGFRLVRDQSRSAVPVVANSDFYETLWTKVRRESALPSSENVAVEELVNYFPYSYPKPDFGEKVRLNVETGVCPWNPQNALVCIGIRAKDSMDGRGDVIVKDLGVIADFNPAMVKGYRLLGYAQCSQDAGVGVDREADLVGGELLSGQTVTAIYEVIPMAAGDLATTDVLKGERGLRQAGKPHPVGLHAGMFARDADGMSDDLLNVRVVFREPGSLRYERHAVSVSSEPSDWNSMDDDFRFAVAVSAFGLRLKGDLDENEMNFDTIGKLAASAVGEDLDGRRAEFLALVKQVRVLDPAKRTAGEDEHVYASEPYGESGGMGELRWSDDESQPRR
ncbi:YfbK domain-containing protein [Sulfuriroseicoccus oceanibius]|uniref:von Willebrand factor type A domain-containing protein n=1 Tax=Sulfuriroseicoccus oceanibius TaxID=2707525 RepID=A0A6B3L8E4_9BACT|nr:von Willebrand factor type A domain-containing protein [Sulfuriroseicoccus oceanibius]QQL43780.1 von Willebrand factor type A domain-containing protein [Sulfuriroseicoccus oceanibius]